ncbi:hypothetical protein B0H10DRAFT_1940606 [Mycena sp. CBHHK59/15]|nr:hypothetical protein B0H10DRAFT_1940606 [Mycena sp. CBHHK59/15]
MTLTTIHLLGLVVHAPPPLLPPPPLCLSPCRLLLHRSNFVRRGEANGKRCMIYLVSSKDLDGLGNFLQLLFYQRPHGKHNVWTQHHQSMVTAFLRGQTAIKMGHIIELIYNHCQSQPPTDSPQRNLAFSHKIAHTDIAFARPSLSSWALVLMGKEACRSVGSLTKNDPTDPTDTTQMQASTNGHAQNVAVANWDKLTENLNILKTVEQRSMIQVGALSSFVLSRNQYVNGYLALPLAVWQFACKSHVDKKRIFSRFGFMVHDTTAHACLDSSTDTSLAKLRASVAEGISVGEMRWQYVLDNQDILKVGTAATAILLEDAPQRIQSPGQSRLGANFGYIHPELAHLRKEVAAAFNSDRMTKHRLHRGRKTVVQLLGTNAERETETQSMMRAMLDFESQMGLDEKAMEGQITTPCSNSASIAAIWQIKKPFAIKFPQAPRSGIHTCNLNGSVCSIEECNRRQAKRPTDLKKVDFFPTSRSTTLFFEARVLDCWCVFFGTNDIITYFHTRTFDLPDLETLWENAQTLGRCYASQEAYHQVLSGDLADSADERMKILRGTPWTTPVNVNVRPEQGEEIHANLTDMLDGVAPEMFVEPGEELEENLSDTEGAETRNKKKKNKKAVHTEVPGFSGDRSVANEILFLQDMGWWVIAAHAVPDGEIGCVWEIMKIWIFCFSGSSNRNYVNYLLETYCLHWYESSKDFSDAMLNNWLVNSSGKKWTKCDFSQEGFNKWLEEMVEHKGDRDELERLIQYVIDNPDMFPEDEEETDEDSNNGDDEDENVNEIEGDIGIHDLEYSDNEDLDGPEGDHGLLIRGAAEILCAAYGGGSLLQASFHGAGGPVHPSHTHGWSSSSLTTPARSQTTTPSLDTGSLAGVDDMSSMSSPLGGRFSDFSGSGFSLQNGAFGSPATSDKALHRVDSLSQQVVVLENTVQKLVSAVSTLTDAVRNPANPNEAFWMREGYTGYFRQPRIAAKSADLARLKTAHPGIKLWLRSDYKKPTSAQRQRVKKAAGATNRINNVNTTGRYIEDWDGEVIGGKELGYIREEARNLFEDVLAVGKATRRYKSIGHQIRCAMVYVLELKFPYLTLCADHWKAALAISDIYCHWAKHIKSGLVGEDGRPDADPIDDPTLLSMSSESPPPPPPPPVDNLMPPLVLPPPAPPVDNSPPPEPETQEDSEPPDLFASVVVAPPPRTLLPPRAPLPPPSPVTTSSTTKSKTAGPKKAEPHATNLYLVVYAIDVGGSTAEFSEQWKALEQEKPPSALFQAYDKYSKELKKASSSRLSVEDIRKHINTIMGPSAAV